MTGLTNQPKSIFLLQGNYLSLSMAWLQQHNIDTGFQIEDIKMTKCSTLCLNISLRVSPFLHQLNVSKWSKCRLCFLTRATRSECRLGFLTRGNGFLAGGL
ncbi:hypothetical protein E2C01_053574 [Portunus trituberculatus]|uniref:Uncharacterized protein n=1 Tax=Portunus trituberculatus TaxID=210409 RepID=A0A5B7GH45_PORTR|nr:hypothetical protein [Portunus trituberculatus]